MTYTSNQVIAIFVVAYLIGLIQGKFPKFFDAIWFFVILVLYLANFVEALTGSTLNIIVTVYLTIAAINTFKWNKPVSTFLMVDQYTAI